MEPLIEMTYPGLVTSDLIARLLAVVYLKVYGYSGELRIVWDSDRLTIEGGAREVPS